MRKSITFADQNMTAAFQFAEKLIYTKSPIEVIQLQQQYLVGQQQALSSQAQELSRVGLDALVSISGLFPLTSRARRLTGTCISISSKNRLWSRVRKRSLLNAKQGMSSCRMFPSAVANPSPALARSAPLSNKAWRKLGRHSTASLPPLA